MLNCTTNFDRVFHISLENHLDLVKSQNPNDGSAYYSTPCRPCVRPARPALRRPAPGIRQPRDWAAWLPANPQLLIHVISGTGQAEQAGRLAAVARLQLSPRHCWPCDAGSTDQL